MNKCVQKSRGIVWLLCCVLCMLSSQLGATNAQQANAEAQVLDVAKTAAANSTAVKNAATNSELGKTAATNSKAANSEATNSEATTNIREWIVEPLDRKGMVWRWFYYCFRTVRLDCIRHNLKAYPQLAQEGVATVIYAKDEGPKKTSISLTRRVLQMRQAAVGASNPDLLKMLEILLHYGAPVEDEDLKIAAGQNRRGIRIRDDQAYSMLQKHLQFLYALTTQQQTHRQQNLKTEHYVHEPTESGAQLWPHPLPLKKMIVYTPTNDQWNQEGNRHILQAHHSLAYTSSYTDRGALKQTPEVISFEPDKDSEPQQAWRRANWPARVHVYEVYQMGQAVRAGRVADVARLLIQNPYVAHATEAIDTNLFVGHSISERGLRDPNRSFLGAALLAGHDDVAALLLSFEAELLPSESRYDRPEWIALNALDKRRADGLKTRWDAWQQAFKQAPPRKTLVDCAKWLQKPR